MASGGPLSHLQSLVSKEFDSPAQIIEVPSLTLSAGESAAPKLSGNPFGEALREEYWTGQYAPKRYILEVVADGGIGVWSQPLATIPPPMLKPTSSSNIRRPRHIDGNKVITPGDKMKVTHALTHPHIFIHA